MTASQRIRPGPDHTKKLLLDASERLMLKDGYAAMTARRIAEEAGCAPSLIFHYFQTIDGVMVALFRRSAQREIERLQQLLATGAPLAAFWDLTADVALSAQFMAFAANNDVIRNELSHHAQEKRELHAKAVEVALNSVGLDPAAYPPEGVTFLLSAIFRAFRTEEAGGLRHGHDEARHILRNLLPGSAFSDLLDFSWRR